MEDTIPGISNFRNLVIEAKWDGQRSRPVDVKVTIEVSGRKHCLCLSFPFLSCPRLMIQ
jgi:hypothetical protein